MGAPCAYSVRHVREDGVWVFTCAMAGEGRGRAIIDSRTEDKDPCERT